MLIMGRIKRSEIKTHSMTKKYVIGLDYGTDSVRSVVVDTGNGVTVGTSVFEYPRWKKGLYCDPSANRFRQHPLDYTEGMEHSVKEALKGLNIDVISNIVGITVDTTGSTPVAVDKHGVPLSLKPGFEEDPDAMFVLWKDHTDCLLNLSPVMSVSVTFQQSGPGNLASLPVLRSVPEHLMPTLEQSGAKLSLISF
jgi:hypothetical protein